MTDAPAGPRLRRSVVPLECLTPPRWAHEADLKGSSAPPSPGSPTSALSPAPTGGPATAKVLVQRLRQVVRQRHYSLRTEKSYAGWTRRFLVFHRYPDPARLGAVEVRAYLTHLAMRQHVSASTQNQAFSALLFLFREVLGRKLEQLDDTPRAKRSVRLMSHTPGYPNDPDGDALGRLAANESKMARPMEIDFVVAVPSREAGDQVAEAARQIGFEVDVENDADREGGDGRSWSCYCSKMMVPDYDALVTLQSELNRIAAPFGGWSDGWGTFGNAEGLGRTNDWSAWWVERRGGPTKG